MEVSVGDVAGDLCSVEVKDVVKDVVKLVNLSWIFVFRIGFAPQIKRGFSGKIQIAELFSGAT